MSRLHDLLIRHEGLRLKPYHDTRNKLTIGVGRNLDDAGITREEALMLLNNDIATGRREIERAFPWVSRLNPAREMLDSQWAKQVGRRAKELAAMMKQGKYRVNQDRV